MSLQEVRALPLLDASMQSIVSKMGYAPQSLLVKGQQYRGQRFFSWVRKVEGGGQLLELLLHPGQLS